MLLGELDLNAAPGVDALGKIDLKFAGTMSGLAKMGAAVAAPLAGFLTFATVLAGLKDAMDLGGALNDLSLRTGESVHDLVILREAFAEAGLGAESVEPFFLKLQNAMGGVNEEGGKTTAAFEALGISIDELKDLDAIGQIEALQKGFAGIADQSSKVQAARNLFGKSGGQALSLLGDPGVLEDAKRRAGPLADLMEKNVGAFDRLGDVVGALKLDFQEFFAGALSKIAPEAENIADALNSIDFVGIGETVGSLAAMFLKLAEPIAFIAGNGTQSTGGLAEKYRGFARLAQSDSSPAKSIVGALQKSGGGGYLGGVADPILTENRRQSQLLERIAANTARREGGGSIAAPAV